MITFFKQKWQKNKNFLSACLLIGLFYLMLSILGIGCPIRFVTGISCAGCGMTRAYLALFHLDIRAAFHFHPLFPLPPVILVLFLFRHKFSEKLFNLILFTIILLFVIVYLYRLFSGSEIVVFRLSESIVVKLVRYLREPPVHTI